VRGGGSVADGPGALGRDHPPDQHGGAGDRRATPRPEAARRCSGAARAGLARWAGHPAAVGLRRTRGWLCSGGGEHSRPRRPRFALRLCRRAGALVRATSRRACRWRPRWAGSTTGGSGASPSPTTDARRWTARCGWSEAAHGDGRRWSMASRATSTSSFANLTARARRPCRPPCNMTCPDAHSAGARRFARRWAAGTELRLGADGRRMRGRSDEFGAYVAGQPTRDRSSGGKSARRPVRRTNPQESPFTLSGTARIDRWTIRDGNLRERVVATACF
jgi:hypothetical protein